MTNRERLGIVTISLFIVFSLISSTKFSNFALIDSITNFVTSISDNMLAKVGDVLPQETPAATAGPNKVQVIHTSGSPLVQLAKINNNQVLSVKQCESPESLARYPINNNNLIRDAKCTAGYVEGTVLNIKTANANNSIALLDELIDLLKGTLNNLNTRGNIDGMVFVGIPTGAEIKTGIESANDITVACINKDGEKIKNQRVGNLGMVPDTMYTNATEAQKASLAFIKNGIKDLNDQVKLSKDTKEDSVQKLLLQAIGIVRKFKSDFLPIDESLLVDNRNFNSSENIKLSVYLEKNNNGQLMVDNPSSFLLGKIWMYRQVNSDVPKIEKPFYKGRVVMTAGEQSIENSEVVIPSKSIYDDLKKTVTNKIEELTKIRSKFVSNLETAQEAKKKLEANGYYCQL